MHSDGYGTIIEFCIFSLTFLLLEMATNCSPWKEGEIDYRLSIGLKIHIGWWLDSQTTKYKVNYVHFFFLRGVHLILSPIMFNELYIKYPNIYNKSNYSHTSCKKKSHIHLFALKKIKTKLHF